MIAEGYSVREIADALKISTQAVHKHLKKIRREQERQHERRVERVS